MAARKHLNLGLVKNHRASEIVTGLLKVGFPHLKPGRTPVSSNDTEFTYAVSVEGAITKTEAAEIVAHVEGIMATLVHLGFTSHGPRPEDYGTLRKVS